ncbi:MAG: hypothetical protein OER95_09910, partial [Acidimicrobiia bacterium]|nr:hypothetical protein [Acidimicrobiia bacterium]
AVLRVFEEIRDVEPGYDDPDGLLAAAENGVEELERLERLDDLHGQAVRLMDAGSWGEARERLSNIDRENPQFRETARLLARCDDELEATAEAELRARRSAALYEEAAALAQAGQWRESIRKLDDLADIEPLHADPERLREQARAALEVEEAQARTQQEAAATYAEAVEDLKAERYQEALDTWSRVTDLDPDFDDRRRVAATARRKLAPSDHGRPRLRVLWIVVVAVVAVAVFAAGWYLTAAGDGVPSMHADFDDADLRYDPEVWRAYPESADIGWYSFTSSQKGALIITEARTDGQSGLALIDHQFDPSRSMFVEARLRLDPQARNGNLMIGLCCEPVDVNCGVGSNGPGCFYQDHSGRDAGTDPVLERDPTVWQAVRIEFDAPSRKFTFTINDALVGSATPSAEVLAETVSGILLRVHNVEGPVTVGYVDYVHVGPLGD